MVNAQNNDNYAISCKYPAVGHLIKTELPFWEPSRTLCLVNYMYDSGKVHLGIHFKQIPRLECLIKKLIVLFLN